MKETTRLTKVTSILLVVLLLGLTVLFGCTTVSPKTDTNTSNSTFSGTGEVQEVYLHALSNGTYSVNEITVKQGSLVTLHFTADPNAGCGRSFVVYGIKAPAVVSKNGEEVIMQFTPSSVGTFEYNCSMRMWHGGKLVVVP